MILLYTVLNNQIIIYNLYHTVYTYISPVVATPCPKGLTCEVSSRWIAYVLANNSFLIAKLFVSTALLVPRRRFDGRCFLLPTGRSLESLCTLSISRSRSRRAVGNTRLGAARRPFKRSLRTIPASKKTAASRKDK